MIQEENRNLPPLQTAKGWGTPVKSTAVQTQMPESSHEREDDVHLGGWGFGAVGHPPALLQRPWVFNIIIPIIGVPILAGVGPAGTIEYNPENNTLCAGAGIGASAGRNVTFGPLTNGTMFNGQYYPSGANSLLSGGSFSGGYTSPFLVGAGGMANGSGAAAGPAFGVPGWSAAATYSVCF
jgi:hypothetical protein